MLNQFGIMTCKKVLYSLVKRMTILKRKGKHKHIPPQCIIPVTPGDFVLNLFKEQNG